MIEMYKMSWDAAEETELEDDRLKTDFPLLFQLYVQIEVIIKPWNLFFFKVSC